jgi:hypothetical protein
MFVEAELPRSEPSIQRACKRGHFDATLGDTEKGQRYFITPDSVIRNFRTTESSASSLLAKTFLRW